MRNKDTHTRITDKCRCLFVVAYSAMSITGLSSVLAVENHALSSPVSDRVESVQQKKHVSGNVFPWADAVVNSPPNKRRRTNNTRFLFFICAFII